MLLTTNNQKTGHYVVIFKLYISRNSEINSEPLRILKL